MRRSDQRRDAVFALYQHEVTGRALEGLLANAKPFSRELAAAVEANRAELDDLISRHSRGWALERIAPLERSIMRVALQEALHDDEVPVEVALDEAVELAKEYCGADAPGFVNGVLGAAVKEPGLTRLDEIVEKLDSLARELDSEPDEDRAAELAREASELAAEAGREVERAVRAAAADPPSE